MGTCTIGEQLSAKVAWNELQGRRGAGSNCVAPVVLLDPRDTGLCPFSLAWMLFLFWGL